MTRELGGVAGRRVGPYRIEGPLGRGGMGEVFKAYDERLDRWVAIKRIRADLEASGERRRRFRREAKATAAVDHPALVQVFDWVESATEEWIVMELVEGRPIHELLTDGPFEIDRALDIARQVAEGLAALHERGWVHRDLKAENILVTAKGRARILDLGLVMPTASPFPAESDLTADGAALGTHRSMSPEQSRGLPVGPSSDLFSLGVLLYEMLTGFTPFRDGDRAATLEKIQRHRQIPAQRRRPEVPEPLSIWLDQLLDKDPSRRPPSAQAVIDKLDELVAMPGKRKVADRSESSVAGTSDLGASTFIPADPGSQEISAQAPSGSFGAERPGRRALIVAGFAFAAWLTWYAAPSRTPAADSVEVSTAEATAAADVEAAHPAPLYVAVTEPVLAVGAPPGDGAAEAALDPLLVPAARSAIFEGLLGLQDLAPLGAEKLHGAPSDLRQMARALGASELIQARLDWARGTCRVTLHRVSALDGEVLWVKDFLAPTDDLAVFRDAIASHLRHAFAGRAERPGARPRSLTGASHRAFLALREAYLSRGQDAAKLLEQSRRLRLENPAEPRLHLLEAAILHDRYFHSKKAEDLDRVFSRLDQAHALDPSNPAALYRLARVAIEAGRLEVADQALDSLEEMMSGDARTLLLEALLLERQGQGEAALEAMEKSVARLGSWSGYFELANLHYRRGEIDSTRGNLEKVLALLPGHTGAHSFLAQLELISGDPERAAELYEELVANAPGLAEFSNLGLARLLEGDYRAASESFERALEIEPDHAMTVLNLADAAELAGRGADAASLYGRVLAMTEAASGDGGVSDWQILTVRAQALAHLDRPLEAVAELQKALRLSGDHPQTAFEAALVYALVDERTSALVHAARGGHLFGPRWFALPWFDSLRGEPGFMDLAEPEAQPPGSG